MIKLIIVDGQGTDRLAQVTQHHALSVAQCCPDVPEVGTVSRCRYWSGLLGTGGLGDTTSMLVDGSTTSVTFYAKSEADYDIRVTHVQILIADLQIPLNRFGNILGGIANGFDLYVQEAGVMTYLMQAVKTNGELITQSGGLAGWDALTAYLANSDALIVRIPVADFISGGLRIGRGTQDRIAAVVKDDLTSLDEMHVRVFGHAHYP